MLLFSTQDRSLGSHASNSKVVAIFPRLSDPWNDIGPEHQSPILAGLFPGETGLHNVSIAKVRKKQKLQVD